MPKEPHADRIDVQNQIFAMLRERPATLEEIRLGVVRPEGRGEKYVTNTVTMMKARGMLAYRMEDRTYSVLRDTPAPPAPARAAAGTVATGAAGPRDVSHDPASKLTGHPAPAHETDDDRVNGAGAASSSEAPDEGEDVDATGERPDQEFGKVDGGHIVVPPEAEQIHRAENIAAAEEIGERLRHEEPPAPPSMATLHIQVDLHIGADELDALGADAGKVLWAARTLIAYEPIIRGARPDAREP